jgi:predicted small lipoprotein YifL
MIMSYRFVVLLALLLSGCGQKGNLYLPQKAPVPAAPPAAPAATAPATTAPAAAPPTSTP